jgi:HPt (histidine-containing phosphotransfer) domain-containing protein
MDDFLTKPIHGHDLRATLDRWLQASEAAEETLPVASAVPDDAAPVARTNGHAPLELPANDSAPVASAPAVAIDLDALRPIMELQEQGQQGLFDELLALFQTDGAAYLAALQEAVTLGEVSRAGRIAHTLRGEALAWGAATLAQRCQQIEHEAVAEHEIGGRHSNGTEYQPSTAAPVLVDDLRQLFQSTVAALEAIRAKSA